MTSLLRWMSLGTVLAAVCSASAADPAALAKRLHNAADLSSLDDPALKPWHLKLDVQLFDAKGKPSEQGTIEEWWTADADKRVYDTPSYTATEIRSGNVLRHTVGRSAVPYLLNAIRLQVVHPMATSEEIDSAKPDLRVEEFGKVRLDCITLDQRIAHISNPSLGLFPAYCLSQGNDQLRLIHRFGSEVSTLDRIGVFQGRRVAIDPMVGIEGVRAVSAHVVTLESEAIDTSFFSSGAELEERSSAAINVDPKLIAKQKLKDVAPILPEKARANRLEGTVHMAVIIGVDGHVQDVKVIDAPDASLALSALDSVRQWTYRPYLLNGVPVEVSTTIAITYTVGN